ncbi:APC family permease [Planktothrix pseudagardhii]|uniref:Transporter MT2055 n=1 Tax=Planktothrix pseudagardhii TaxID=132604 RepID=A0A9W4D9P5_9CYAN|nr:amino acid permease [Planktothrix pseudagardhii]CAD5983598.1 putative transporter MT2055 [Planktothrix pseudagardhii]
MADAKSSSLKREIGVLGAIGMGLGSIIGTGVFVSIGIVAGLTGTSVIVAVILAAFVALCNGLNSAQLAANHPVSGGTYEYGYKYLNPGLGFIAGWMFLLAKTASAATAALGFSGYLILMLGVSQSLFIPIALFTVFVLTAIVFTGIRRSNTANLIIVSITLFSLLFFIISGLPLAFSPTGLNHFLPFFPSTSSAIPNLLEATALMFVAYTGYGRIATMGEEVKDPEKTIPQAMIITVLISMLLYLGVALVAVGVVGTETLSLASITAAPLEQVANRFALPGSNQVITLGAMTAMLGVLLNLILGLSRVVFAMGKRHDLPRFLAQLNTTQTTPTLAVIVVGIAIAVLVLIGNVKTTWSFSAFTVLIYYSITNLAALKLTLEEQLYSPILAYIGLVSCLFLAVWIEPKVWLLGFGLMLVGWILRLIIRHSLEQ